MLHRSRNRHERRAEGLDLSARLSMSATTLSSENDHFAFTDMI
jgi:hypothetical protein